MKSPGASSREKGLFHVAAKVFLRDGDRVLLPHDVFGDWDLPGGRVLPSEFGGDLNGVIKRKMTEELGSDLAYNVKGIDTYFQVTRKEHDSGQESRIFAVGFSACYLGGSIKLGAHHDEYKWVDLHNLRPSDYFEHGWEVGVERYIASQTGG
jgi:8-oxo-dGTP pyrophosphatase MutT (NUDIX family)